MENHSNDILAIDNFSLEYLDCIALFSKGQTEQMRIFTDEDLQVLERHGKREPNWKFMFFDWMPPSIMAIYLQEIEKIYSHSNVCFIKGLMAEYGISKSSPKPPNYRKALDYYLAGSKLNNQYCLFKLFYILKDDQVFDKYGLKRNTDLSVFFLIKASSYNESFLDLNKIDPIIKLMHIVYFRDKDLNRVRLLLERIKYDNNDLKINIDDIEFKYLYNFLRLNFCNRDLEFKDSLTNLEAIADSHPEACYKLACLYYNPIHKEICPKNIDRSVQLFESLFKKSYAKSYCSYYKICEELKLNDRIEGILLFCKKNKNYSAQFYANFLSRNKDDIVNSKSISKIFRYFFSSFLYGNLISLVISHEIISQIILKNICEIPEKICERNENLNLYSNSNCNFNFKNSLQLIFDFVSTRKNDPTLNKILDYDILILFHQIHAYFYYKGILVKKNIPKAIEILEDTFQEQKSIKNYRKVFYYLGKCYKKLGNVKKSNFFLKTTFDIYIMLKEFPYHHYLVGKLFLKGIPGVLEKNLINAYKFLYMGANYQDNYFFINSFYSRKCSIYLTENQAIKDIGCQLKESLSAGAISLSVNLEEYVNEENICIICFSNFKQIIFAKCGHKCLCYLCFEKLNKGEINSNSASSWKCPICQQESKQYLNSFNVDLEIEPFPIQSIPTTIK